jgi:hypothetical protein
MASQDALGIYLTDHMAGPVSASDLRNAARGVTRAAWPALR